MAETSRTSVFRLSVYARFLFRSRKRDRIEQLALFPLPSSCSFACLELTKGESSDIGVAASVRAGKQELQWTIRRVSRPDLKAFLRTP